MVAMITCISIHISQEIFAIDVLTALKSSLEQPRSPASKHVLRLLRLYGDQAQADQCKEQFFVESYQTGTVCGLLEEVLYQ